MPKPDGSYKMSTDYRKVNSVTTTHSLPLPWIDDCIDKIGHAKYVTKFDLLKEFWQVPRNLCHGQTGRFVSIQGIAIWNEKFACYVPASHQQWYRRTASNGWLFRRFHITSSWVEKTLGGNARLLPES